MRLMRPAREDLKNCTTIGEQVAKKWHKYRYEGRQYPPPAVWVLHQPSNDNLGNWHLGLWIARAFSCNPGWTWGGRCGHQVRRSESADAGIYAMSKITFWVKLDPLMTCESPNFLAD